MKYPVKNAPGLLKDSKTGVVINTNEAEYQLILEKRKAKKREEEVDDLKARMAKLEELLLSRNN